MPQDAPRLDAKVAFLSDHPMFSDIARAALFLGSDLSSYSTGITLDVNGGMLIH